MAANNRWSNHRLHAACAGLSPEAFRAPRTGFFPSLAATLDHILLIDRYYLAALTGSARSIDILEAWVPRTDAAALAAAQRASDDELCTYCERLSAADLDRVIVIDRGPGRLHREAVGATLTHLFVHQIHHRGQAHAMLSGAAVAPPQLDEFFLDADAALRAPDLAAMGS
jgi:uncharacterized damage-inducible protein DinB